MTAELIEKPEEKRKQSLQKLKSRTKGTVEKGAKKVLSKIGAQLKSRLGEKSQTKGGRNEKTVGKKVEKIVDKVTNKVPGGKVVNAVKKGIKTLGKIKNQAKDMADSMYER